MSKISITPNASGTGVFTISSPATNTDRTLTLPDEAGTVLTSASSLASDNLTGTVTVSGGNVGIGTSSPAHLVDAISTTGGAAARFGTTYNTGSNDGTVIISNGGSGDAMLRFDYEGSNTDRARIGVTASDQNLQFFTAGNNERMRIDSSGNVLVGKLSASDASDGLWVTPTGTIFATTTSTYAAQFRRNGTDGVVVYFYNDATFVGSINVSGSSTSYNTSSDYRLKTDAQPMVGASARVQALKPVNFEWISSGDRVDGFLAHEAQAVVPECVTGTKDAMRDEEYEVTAAVLDDDGNVVTEAVIGTRSVPDYQGIDQSKLVPLLTAALQEALTEISALKVRVAALEAV